MPVGGGSNSNPTCSSVDLVSEHLTVEMIACFGSEFLCCNPMGPSRGPLGRLFELFERAFVIYMALGREA